MGDVTQIRVGKHVTGIIGLNSALEEAVARCKGMSDDRIARFLVELLSKSNDIEAGIKTEYAQTFLREYKKMIGEPVAEAHDQGLHIKVLGPGCPQCERLEQQVMAVMAETGTVAELEHVRDLTAIGRYGVMGSPALIINNEVKAVGSVPSRTKIETWIEQAAKQIKS